MSQVTEQELLDRAQDVVTKANAYKELIFQHEIFKHKSKAFLSALKMEFEGSDASKETQALADPRWTKFLDEQIISLKDAGRAKMELEAAQVRYEAMRSALSSRKAEVGAFR